MPATSTVRRSSVTGPLLGAPPGGAAQPGDAAGVAGPALTEVDDVLGGAAVVADDDRSPDGLQAAAPNRTTAHNVTSANGGGRRTRPGGIDMAADASSCPFRRPVRSTT